ncbi:MAG: hypothetical protein U9R75_00140, partial [Candidatus Thermoplasmatota archaeon]|nr:hypothetical protein [Candidatus Thermoplasmatota archaeon]
LSFGMGFRIEVLGTTIKEWEKTDIIDFRRLIATSMDDLAGEWIVEKLDYAVQLSGPILSCSSRDELVLVYTSIDPETGYFPIRMALLKEGIWSFEELLFSNEYDMMDIALSDNGDVNLAYFEGGSKQYIEVVKWDGSTTSSFRFNDPDMKGMHVSDLEMVLDDQGRPNIYYVLTETTGSYGFFEFSPSILKRAVLDGFYFTNTTLLENRSITGLDLEMSNDDTVHMSYMNTRIEIYHQYLIYSELRNGSWSNTTVFHDDAIFNNPSHTSLELDGDGNPSIMFDDNNGSVKYYRFRNSVWKREETPQIGGSYHGIFSHHILGGADPVCSYIGSSGDQSHVFHFSLLGLEGWNSVSVLEWKSWRFPGGTDIEESGNRVYIAFNDGLYLRVASKEISSTVP